MRAGSISDTRLTSLGKFIVIHSLDIQAKHIFINLNTFLFELFYWMEVVR